MRQTSRTIHRAVAAAAALGLLATAATALQPAILEAQQAQVAVKPSDDWLKGVKATHRQFFDGPQPAGGVPLVHIMNYYDTYNKAYNVKDADIDAVSTFYGLTTFYALNDAMWSKYKLGEFLETDGPTPGTRATANPWRATPVILGMNMPQASIEALQKRGATFILCNNALGIFANMLAQKRGLDPATVYADLNANILPGVHLVPGMVVAIEQAHRAGLSYQRQ
jgi:hypothetical protein